MNISIFSSAFPTCLHAMAFKHKNNIAFAIHHWYVATYKKVTLKSNSDSFLWVFTAAVQSTASSFTDKPSMFKIIHRFGNLKMATKMFVKTLINSQHSTRIIPESRNCTFWSTGYKSVDSFLAIFNTPDVVLPDLALPWLRKEDQIS